MNRLNKIFGAALCLASAAGFTMPQALAQEAAQPKTAPAGEPKSAKTNTWEIGAKILQSTAPLKPFDVYMVVLHPRADHPEARMEAHH